MKNHVVPLRIYFTIIIALLVLTTITVKASQQDFGVWNDVVAMGIAALKMFLVAAFFMHLKWSARIVWLFAGAGLVWFCIMIALMLADFESRAWQVRPQAWEMGPAKVPTPPVPHGNGNVGITDHGATLEPAPAAHH